MSARHVTLPVGRYWQCWFGWLSIYWSKCGRIQTKCPRTSMSMNLYNDDITFLGPPHSAPNAHNDYWDSSANSVKKSFKINVCEHFYTVRAWPTFNNYCPLHGKCPCINCVPDIFPAEMCPVVYNCVPDILPAETVSRGAGLRLSKIECPRTLTRVRERSRIMSSGHLFRGGCGGCGKYEESRGH